MSQNCDMEETHMAFKENTELLFVRVPMTAQDKQKIDRACAVAGMKKYEWVRRALLAEASKKEVRAHD